MPHDSSHVLHRIDALRAENQPLMADRFRIRQIMNGGPDGIAAVMAWDQGKGSSGKKPPLGDDLPAVNMMASGVDRLAQKVGQAPTLRMPYGPRDNEPAKIAAELRERVVEGWDSLSRVHLTYPQVGRWLPGYGFAVWVIRPRVDPVTRQMYPHVEIRDPYDAWTGYYGPGQQPAEIAFRRSVTLHTLMTVYPEYDWHKMAKDKMGDAANANRITPVGAAGGPVGGQVTWEGVGGGTQVIEYYDHTGCYVACPEFEMVMDYTPNICETGPMFVVGKRYSFDRLLSQYHHIIGLVAMMAKFNVLSLVATEEAAFSEINIFGELEGNTYERGKKGINFLDPNARVEKPKDGSNFNIFSQIDRIERQLRIGAAYDAGSDSIAARGGFITGRGQQELRDPIEANISEYQLVIAASMEDVDTRRLEWEERHEKSKKKRVFWLEGGRQGEETYVPKKDIGGFWRSKRAYGMMATWDDNSKIVAGLQLLQGNIIDVTTFQENLHGLDNLPQIRQRSIYDRSLQGLLAALEQRGAMGDPGAMLALVELNAKPDQAQAILRKFFTPQEPQMTPEEQAMAAGQPAGPPGSELNLGPGPTVQTVLSEMEQTGGVGGGVQTVNVNRR